MLKILTATQIREADAYTISHEPVSAIDLTERAAEKCVNWISNYYSSKTNFKIFCGNGNNGADGLVIARLLYLKGKNIEVYISSESGKYAPEFNINLSRLKTLKSIVIKTFDAENDLPLITSDETVIDTIFGTGLNRAVEGQFAALINHINNTNCEVISIDIPSGLSPDQSVNGKTIIATHTLTFQFPKLSFFFPENSMYTGTVHILDIGLHTVFIKNVPANNFLLEENDIITLRKKRNAFSHKGNYGHAVIIAGSYGKMGAALLSCKACIRSGAGLVTAVLPKSGYNIMQTAIPEVMVMTDSSENNISNLPEVTKFNVVGIGPGIGNLEETGRVLKLLIQNCSCPIVFDADAINILSENKTWLAFIPKGSVLTPHPGEFERLAGNWSNGFERLDLQTAFSKKYSCYVVLKDHHTCISCPDGKSYFNPTGNAGMATAGSGDVLTGMITGLIAQGYSPRDAALAGVYLHGLAGDIAAEKISMESMIASDIIDNIGKAFLHLSKSELK